MDEQAFMLLMSFSHGLTNECIQPSLDKHWGARVVFCRCLQCHDAIMILHNAKAEGAEEFVPAISIGFSDTLLIEASLIKR